jgi:hypothetical protein
MNAPFESWKLRLLWRGAVIFCLIVIISVSTSEFTDARSELSAQTDSERLKRIEERLSAIDTQMSNLR